MALDRAVYSFSGHIPESVLLTGLSARITAAATSTEMARSIASGHPAVQAVLDVTVHDYALTTL